jgi:acyl-CoA dehydrogenase
MTADDLLISTTTKILSETSTFEAVEQAEQEGWAPDVWDALATAGLPWVGIPEQSGGVGGTLEDAMAILRVAGAHAAPVPLAETGSLAGWLLSRAALEIGDGPLTLAPGAVADTVGLAGAALTGVANHVPWARQARRLVLLLPDGPSSRVVVVDPATTRIEPVTNLAGEPRDRVHFDSTPVLESAVVDLAPQALLERGALTRVVLSAGALQKVSEITIGYTAERTQFGKPVSRFQLVQRHLVHLAQEAALLSMAADAAVRAAAGGSGSFEIAAARAIALSASATGTRAAHQAHGAMGMTREYRLHHLTRRLWAWQHEYGKIHHWQAEVSRHAASAGADHLYNLIGGQA